MTKLLAVIEDVPEWKYSLEPIEAVMLSGARPGTSITFQQEV